MVRLIRNRRRFLLHVTVAILLLLGVGGLGAVAFVVWGVYDVSAIQQHTRPVYDLLGTALRRSIRQRGEQIDPPPLDRPVLLRDGFRHYHRKCVQCHGAPGVARDDIGKGLTPMPGNLVHTGREWSAGEIFWTVKNGIKMSGMPAWRFTFTDEQLWAIVAFIKRMPYLTALEYQALVEEFEATPQPPPTPEADERPLPPADPARGRLALQHYACTACHAIPGVIGPEAPVGPPLQGIAQRRYIAGVLTNTVENMVRWIRDPPAVDPLTTMPDLSVSRQDAVDIAAYLWSLSPSGESQTAGAPW